MKRPGLLLSAFCAGALALSAAAAPLRRADIPADPEWVFHVDCDSLRQAYLGKYLLYQLNKPEMKSSIAAFQSLFSFDIRSQIHGLTWFCNGPTEMDNVSLLYADFVPGQLIKFVTSAEGAQTIKLKGHVVYSWVDRGKNSGETGVRKFAAFEGKRIVVGASRRAITGALAVMDGSSPNLAATNTWPKLGNASPDTFLQGEARSMGFLSSDPQLQLLKLSRHLELRAREAGEKLDAALTADVPDESTARQMNLIAEGLIALLRLQKEHPEFAKVADGLSITEQKTKVTLTLSMPSKDFVAAWKDYNSIKIKGTGRRD